LEGDVVITFTSVARATTVGVDTKARSGGFSAAFFDPGEDVYLAVIYTPRMSRGNKTIDPGSRPAIAGRRLSHSTSPSATGLRLRSELFNVKVGLGE
jgi:hypothetical protein